MNRTYGFRMPAGCIKRAVTTYPKRIIFQSGLYKFDQTPCHPWVLPCGLVPAHRFTFFNNSGVSAVAIYLPGHGVDATPPGLITLNDYARSITDALTEPTLLAGPSAGGFAITAAAERDPSHVAGLIYLSACIPAPGLSLADLRRAGPCQPLGRALHLSDDRLPFIPTVR
jgi:pimeloyl-ACP methyl ester carboxylesterase